MNSTAAQSFESAIASANRDMNGKVAVGMSGKLAHRMRGYTSGMLVKTACGHTINALSMPLAEALASGYELCTLCDGRNSKAAAPKIASDVVNCTECGERNTSKTSEFCSVCRPYHAHEFKKMGKAQRESLALICAANGRDVNVACAICGLADDDKLHG